MKKQASLDFSKRMLFCALCTLSSAGIVASPMSGGNLSDADVVQVVAQNGKTVKGIVTDSYGPVPGANVLVKGTTNGVITDIDGNFTITNVPDNAVLVVSFIGYVTQEVKVAGQSNFTIRLSEDAKALEEVVVVGYGSQKKVNLTGSIGQVDSKVLESRPITSPASALQGTIPNLQITNTSGEPGQTASLNIRGTTSINGGSPLVLVDGVEMSLDLVNPNDIANVTVLKDAAASAIYGVRAAYGVVLVTTKTAGKDMKTSISYSGNVSFSKPTVLPDMLDKSSEYAEFINRANLGGNRAARFTEDWINGMKAYENDPKNNPAYAIVNGTMRYYGNTDWVDLMLKKLTPSHRHNVNISGGNEKTKFYSSIGYYKQDGMYKYGTDSFKQLNTRLNVENQTTSWMKLGAKFLYNYSAKDAPHKYKDDTWHAMCFSAPTRMPFQWQGDPNYPEYDEFIGKYFQDQNPISLLDQGGRKKTMVHDVWATASADFTFTEHWRARVDFTYNLNYKRISDQRKSINMIKDNFTATQGDTADDSYRWDNYNKDYYSFNAYTEYERTFGEKHYLKGMLGFNQELTKYSTFWGRRKGMLLQNLPSLGLGTGAQEVGEDGYEWALRGGFFRLNYIYNDRYLIEVNGRYDGTSRFPSDNRFVFLPSFSAAWRISEEPFMQSTRGWLDNLKLRGSYGVLGNQLLTADTWTGNTKYYPYIPFMSSDVAINWMFNDNNQSTVINPAGLVSDALTWEKASTVNVGLDVTLFNQRFDASFDYYQRTTSDMLVKVSYPEVLGATAPPANDAELRTRGWELSLGWKDKIGKDIDYSIGFILSDSQAEITKYRNDNNSLSDHYVGKKIGEIWGYETEGIFQSDEEVKNHPSQSKINSGKWEAGDIKYKNLNGDNEISNGKNTLDDHGDLKIIGNTTPRYQYGINGSIGYKDVYLSFFFQGVGKRDFWPSAQNFWPAATTYFNVQKWHVSDSWSEDNPNAYFARPRAYVTKNQQKQTRYLQDASYCRMKNLTIGWNLPTAWIRNVFLSKATVYISGENLFEFTNIKGPYDPEAARGNGSMLYPFQRTYSFGVNLTF